jgi:hypothetical protein
MKTLRDVRDWLAETSCGTQEALAILDAAIAREEQTAKSFVEWWGPTEHGEEGARLRHLEERAFAAGRASRDAEGVAVDLDQPAYTCKLCGKPRLEWQVYCGAACCARWERGDRPKDVQKERSAGPKGASEEDTGHTSQHLARQMGSHEPGTTSDKPGETGIHVSRYYCSICGETYLSPAKVQHACWVPRDKPGETGANPPGAETAFDRWWIQHAGDHLLMRDMCRLAFEAGELGEPYRGVPAPVVLAAGRAAVDGLLASSGNACLLCCPDKSHDAPHASDCPLRDVGPEGGGT